MIPFNCGHPLDITGQQFNIVTGQLADINDKVNSMHLSEEHVVTNEDKLPECILTRLVILRQQWEQGINMSMRNHGQSLILHLILILNRTLWIFDSVDFSLTYLFSNELAPSTTPLLKPATPKSIMVKVVVQSCRTLPNPDVVVLEECAILWPILIIK